MASVALEVDSFSLIVERALFFELAVLAAVLLFDSLDDLGGPLSVVEILEPLPPELSSLVVVVVVVGDAGVLPVSWIERYAGTRWCRSLACARICTLSISLMNSGHRFDHPLCAPPVRPRYEGLGT
jgi:hypothetical protein